MYVKYSFDEIEIQEIQEALKKEKNTVIKERMQAVYMTMQNLKRKEVELHLNRSRHYIGKWLKNYKEYGLEGFKERRGGVRHYYLSQDQELFIKDIVTHSFPKDCNYDSPVWSGALLVDLIKNMFGKTYTREGVYALLKRLGVSYKKANKVDPKKSLKVIQEWKLQMEKNSTL